MECLNNLPKVNLSDVLDQHVLDAKALVDKATSVMQQIYEERL